MSKHDSFLRLNINISRDNVDLGYSLWDFRGNIWINTDLQLKFKNILKKKQPNSQTADLNKTHLHSEPSVEHTFIVGGVKCNDVAIQRGNED